MFSFTSIADSRSQKFATFCASHLMYSTVVWFMLSKRPALFLFFQAASAVSLDSQLIRIRLSQMLEPFVNFLRPFKYSKT